MQLNYNISAGITQRNIRKLNLRDRIPDINLFGNLKTDELSLSRGCDILIFDLHRGNRLRQASFIPFDDQSVPFLDGPLVYPDDANLDLVKIMGHLTDLSRFGNLFGCAGFGFRL